MRSLSLSDDELYELIITTASLDEKDIYMLEKFLKLKLNIKEEKKNFIDYKSPSNWVFSLTTNNIRFIL